MCIFLRVLVKNGYIPFSPVTKNGYDRVKDTHRNIPTVREINV